MADVAPDSVTDPMIGTSAGNYRITRRVSVGGMGTVYAAEHALIGRTAAVKVLQPEFTNNREIVNRFFNEAKATTAIKHPGIVEIFDFGYLTSGHAYIVMEFLDGVPMSRRLKNRGPMAEGEAAMVLRGVCSALAAAHDKGIVHRDLKPDNIFLVPDPDTPIGERPKILDFGIAKLTDLGAASAHTKTGSVMGTPSYMSPEQCRGSGEVDHRADLYSIGCIFYEMLTGRPPFAKQGAGEVIGAHLYVQPDPPSHHVPTLGADTVQLVMALLAKDPAARPQTARELNHHLTALAQRHGWSSASMPDAGVHARWSSESITQPGPPHVTPAPMGPHTPITVGMPVGPAAHGRMAEAAAPFGYPTPVGPPTPVGMPTPVHPATQPMPGPALAPIHPAAQPTTLSGAASQAAAARSGSRRGIAIAAVALCAIAGAGVGLGVARSGRDTAATPPPAAAPASEAPAAPTPPPPSAQATAPATTTPPAPAAASPTAPSEPPATASQATPPAPAATSSAPTEAAPSRTTPTPAAPAPDPAAASTATATPPASTEAPSATTTKKKRGRRDSAKPRATEPKRGTPDLPIEVNLD